MMKPQAIATHLLLCCVSVALLACDDSVESQSSSKDAGLPAADTARGMSGAMPAEERQVFFGDLHLHSRWSFDAYSLNVAVGPEDAYRFARGEPIPHISGGDIQLDGPPLDFMALTEHAEYLGVATGLEQPASGLKSIDLIARYDADDPAIRGAAVAEFASHLTSGIPNPELVTAEVITPAWQRLIELADRYYEPGKFTTFVGFEWTSMPVGNLHRNLIFRGSQVPDRPYSAFDSVKPEDLWTWMEKVRLSYDDILAIPHNGNMSDGTMYPLEDSSGIPLSAAWARRRNRNEPITEIMQIKGQSETLPALSPRDEWANFEVYNRSILDLMAANGEGEANGSYARQALREGVRLWGQLGENPYEMGMIGSTDGHNAAGPINEERYFGKLGSADGTVAQRLQGGREPFIPDVVARWSAAGLAGVWAGSNTREALFDALRRKETFSTSGTRIAVRFFAGDLSQVDLEAGDWVAQAYGQGVPMGGQLAPDTSRPHLLYWAARDPLSAPIERVQVIKGWVTAAGDTEEMVIDIACGNGSTPKGNPGRCQAQTTPSSSCAALKQADGAPVLQGLWQDPDFNPTQTAFYYLRVLETPTCRWTTYQIADTDITLPEGIPEFINERAVTSPVWYRGL